MTENISLKTFLHKAKQCPRGGDRLIFRGTVEKVPVVYVQYRLEIKTLLVGKDRHDETPVRRGLSLPEIQEHLREIILSEQMQQFLAKRA